MCWVELDGCEATAGTGDTTGRSVVQEIGRRFGGEPTDRGEPLEVVVTAENGNRELVQEEKRNGLLPI